VPTDNVVPIDAEVARAIARRATKFRWFVAALATVWLGTLIPVLLFTPLPPLVPFLVLGALVVVAEHRFVLFGDETSMSGSIIVAIASVFVFADTAPLAGPMLVASLGGLYLPHVRERDVSKLVTNAGAMSLAALGASLASGLNSPVNAKNFTEVAASIALAAAAYWSVNNTVVAAYLAGRDGVPLGPSLSNLLTSDASVLVCCCLASEIVVLGNGQLSVQVTGVAACVGANLLAMRQSWVGRATAFWKRNSFVCELSCWTAATVALAATGAPQVHVGVLAGSGVGYAIWTRTQTSFAATVGTAMLAFLAIGWLDPIAQAITATLGVAFLCVLSFTPCTLRSMGVVTGTLLLDSLVAGHPRNGTREVLGTLVCVTSAAVLPQLLAALHQRVRRGGVSVATLVGMSIPSRWEAAVVFGSSVVLTAFAVDFRTGVVASTLWLVPIGLLNGQRNINYRRSAVGASR
jgi:hypothetical protein